MKWKSLVALIVLAVTILSPTAISAADLEGVVVEAVPYAGGEILNFTATMISDTQVDLSWTRASGAVNAMVRAKYGEMPMSRTDGYLVYEGALEVATDNSMNFDETASILYYRI